MSQEQHNQVQIDQQLVKGDVDAMFRSHRLCRVIRFRGKRFWEEETKEEKYVARVLGDAPRFESVADHSWHLADCASIVGPRIQGMCVARAVMLAVMHDKLELWTDDRSPLGRDGTGEKTFAFNADLGKKREEREREAAELYLATLEGSTRDLHRELLTEILEDSSVEARFVRALDKLQVFVYILARKGGNVDNLHVAFNIRYASRFVSRVPGLRPYYEECLSRLLDAVAKERGVEVGVLRTTVVELAFPPQKQLPFGPGVPER